MGKKTENNENAATQSDGEEEEEYAVEKILDRRVRKGKVSTIHPVCRPWPPNLSVSLPLVG